MWHDFKQLINGVKKIYFRKINTMQILTKGNWCSGVNIR